MKLLPAEFTLLLKNGSSRRNLHLLSKFLLLLAGMVALYSVLFHVLMSWEGQTGHSWLSGVYWALMTMSTLGYGDITFHSDLGRIYSVVVLISGVVFLLILLPFTFIEFFYAPWLEAQRQSRVPRRVPGNTAGHVVLTNYGPRSEEHTSELQSRGHLVC